MKQSQQQLKERAFLNMLTMSVFSMVLAMVFLASSTWAWFSTDLSTAAPSGTIKTSSYHVEKLELDGLKSNISKEGNREVYSFYTEDSNGDPIYTLPQGDYLATVYGKGTGNGYCKIIVVSDGVESASFTQIIRAGITYTFTVTLPNDNSTLKIIPVWGTYSGTATVTVTEKTGV